jgi:hypothetical protein
MYKIPPNGYIQANQRAAYPGEPRMQFALEPLNKIYDDAYTVLGQKNPVIPETVFACDILYRFYESRCLNTEPCTLNQFLGIDHEVPFENLTKKPLIWLLFEKQRLQEKSFLHRLKQWFKYAPSRDIQASLPKDLQNHPRFETTEVQITPTLIHTYILFAHFLRDYFQNLEEQKQSADLTEALNNVLRSFSLWADLTSTDLLPLPMKDIKNIFRNNDECFAKVNRLTLLNIYELINFMNNHDVNSDQKNTSNTNNLIIIE